MAHEHGIMLNDRFSRLFKYRGSKVINAETDQHRTRADRTCISEFETHYLQQRSTELLLQNDFVLTKVLCQLDVSGDRAATMASHLVSFLRGNPQASDHVERFVMDAFDVHVKKYSATSPNPRNVLRDNNLATMLVVCYLQQSCRDYLVSILQPVMTAIAPYVENCELDPVRLQQGDGVGVTARNSYNLYCVCRSVLDAVFSAAKHAPIEMQRLCALIRSRIESAWDMQMVVPQTPVTANRKSVQKQKESVKQQQPMLELREWETDLKSTVQVDIMSDIKAALDEWLENPETAAAVVSAQAKAEAKAQRLTQSSHMTPVSAPSGGAPRPPQKDEKYKVRSTDGSDANSTRQSIVDMMSSSFSNLRDPDTTLSIRGSSGSATAPRTSKARSPISAEVKDSWRQTPNSRKHMSPAMSQRLSKHASKRYSGSYFSPVETVISMLIFVRFFIPILTAPNAYGIDVKMSPANRRGLLLCAKVLAVLCNGVSFGAKETYLMSMNGLIREYRPKLRTFLHTISAGAGQNVGAGHDSADGESDDDDESDDECSDGDTVTIDELASQFKVVTVGAKIATKEEQRKSRMSFSRATHLGNAPLTPDTFERDIPPVPPMPLPPIPPQFQRQQQQQQHRHQRNMSDGNAASMSPFNSQMSNQAVAAAAAATTAASRPPPSTRSTIDLPSRTTRTTRAPSNSLSMAGAVAVSTTAGDSLVDNEIVDESLVTIDFLISLEGNFSKLETYVHERTFGLPNADREHLQLACRELKPIVHYAKNLSTPGRMPETVSISATRNNSQELAHRQGIPFSSKQSQESVWLSEEFEDLGNQRLSTLPENLNY
ncbi:hypothetical protein LPJ53_000260 [Coemansia erecta]|uniref:Ras-GAP domain-containing protein n=1 Tax=Coemansia erecta TaxID=147472 RepID=A0A9W8CTD3_9FUNG|nr:hypothetical protein LPJ53_000260 [Coemansia erecta]